MRTIYILFIIFLLSFSCSKESKNPVDSGGDDTPVANCGPDLTVKVGELAVVDVSASLPKDKSKIIDYGWNSDENNPWKTAVYWVSPNTTKHYFGFTKPGTYKLILTVATQKARSNPDTLTVNVLPRTNTIIEDPALELAIRYSKKYATGDITHTFLSEVDSISVIYYPITSLNGIEKCNNLKVFNLGLLNLKDISIISSLTKLEYLDLNQNDSLNDISPVRNLVNLRYLNLSSCNSLKTVEPLSGLILLSYLNLDGDKKMDGFQNLSNLVNLNELIIDTMNESENGDISFLSKMIKLKKLWVLGSGISDITPLKNFTELKELNLEANKISDINPLKNLINLEYLDLCTNRIEDIGHLRALNKLTNLILSSNIIEDLTPITMLKNLGELEIYSNRIYNIKPILDNECLNSIRGFINLDKNPLDSISVHVYIPKLRENGATVRYSE